VPTPYANANRMNAYIALLRGINIGGNNILPMPELVAALEAICANAVFRCAECDPAELAGKLTREIGKRHGFAPHVLILGIAALKKAIADNPFPEAERDPSTLSLCFLAAPPLHPNLEKLAAIRKDSERFRLGDGVFYLHTPEGAGRSKLVTNAERLLGVPMTGRNWRTVCRILALDEEASSYCARVQ